MNLIVHDNFHGGTWVLFRAFMLVGLRRQAILFAGSVIEDGPVY